MANQSGITSEGILALAQGHKAAGALNAGIELELFTAIAEGCDTSEKLAAAKHLPQRTVQILCDALVALDVLNKREGKYVLPETSAAMLVKGRPGYFGGMITLNCRPTAFAESAQMSAVVRAGHALTDSPAEQPNNPDWEFFQRHSRQLASNVGPGAAEVAAELVGQVHKILDVACGSGIYGISAAKRFPQATLTLTDWPNVLIYAGQVAQEEGVRDRVELRGGDIFKDDLGRGYDLVVASNIFHTYSPENDTRLATRLYEAMLPGGLLMIIDMIADEERATNRVALMFALSMMLSTQGGNTYTFSDFKRILGPVGFKDFQLKRVPSPRSTHAVTARK